jgi:WD40 repeat protein
LEQLLDWHIDRLSKEETELVYWLAIEREPVNLVALYNNVISSVSRKNMPSTLQTIQRRIPLERVGSAHFTLQPVLLEHVTERLVTEIVDGIERAIPSIIRAGSRPFSKISRVAINAVQAFNDFPLIKATAKENVRESQRRLILGPVAERLAAAHGRELNTVVGCLLDVWRRETSGELGYIIGNIINLLSYLSIDMHGFNFSHLPIWQACLHDVNLHSTDFSFCRFRHTTFRHPFGTVFSVCYSPDGEFIAIGDDNGEIRLFFAANGQPGFRCVGHSDVVSAVAFSPQGNLIASASYDNTVRLWDSRDGRCINIFVGHRGWVYALAFSADGKTLATVSEDGTCRLWDVQTGKWASPKIQETGFLASVAFSPDGKMLAVAGRSRIVSLFRISDLKNPIQLVRHEARVSALAFSSQGDLLASAGEDHQIHLWRPDQGSHVATFSGHSDSINSLSFSSAGDILASASMDHTVRLWSTVRRECVGELRVAPARIWAVQCNPTNRTLATGSEDGAVRVWDMDTCECIMTLRGYSNKTWSLCFSSTQSLLAAANEDGLVRLWNIQEGRTRMELRGHASRVWAVACSPDGRWVASASDDLSVRLWNLQSGACRYVMHGHADWIRALAFDPTSQVLASAAEDGRILLWDVSTGAQVMQIECARTRLLFSVAFYANGRCIAAGGEGNRIHLFSSKDGARIGELTGHDGWVSAIVPLNPEAFTFASCSEDGTVKLWDLEQMACIGTLTVGCKVWCGSYYNRGESFVSGSEDGMLGLWSLKSGRCESQARAHQGAVWSLAVNPTGDVLATAGNDGSVRLWHLPELMPYAAAGTLRPARPYEGMNITGATGITSAQTDALLALGAINMPSIH